MRLKIFLFLILLFLIICEDKMNEQHFTIEELPTETIQSIASKKILFGHKSVGNNIMQGVQDIIASNEHHAELKIKLLDENKDITEPGFYHYKNGKNHYPKSKCDNFLQVLSKKNLGTSLDIAFFKFCYVDIHKNINIEEIFDYYVKTIDSIKTKFPRLTIVHVTTPLYVHSKGIKAFIRNLIKGDLANVKRNEFNELLRTKYGGSEPIYDLAKIESQMPDGKTSTFKYKNNVYNSLSEKYTDDGGHLNKLGRYLAAKELLTILAEIKSQGE